jgi:hypothetical protein
MATATRELSPAEIAQAALDGHRRAHARQADKVDRAKAEDDRVASLEAKAVAEAAKAKDLLEAYPDDTNAKNFTVKERLEQTWRSKRAASREKLEKERAALAELDRQIEQAEIACKRTSIEDEIDDLLETERAGSARMFALLVDTFELAEQQSATVEHINSLVQEARSLGSAREPSDGLQGARGFAEAILASGHDLAGVSIDHFNPTSGTRSVVAGTLAARAALEVPRGGHALPPAILVTELASIASQALARPPSVHGRTALEQELSRWGTHPSHVAATLAHDEAENAIRQLRAQAMSPEPDLAAAEAARKAKDEREAFLRRGLQVFGKPGVVSLEGDELPGHIGRGGVRRLGSK